MRSGELAGSRTNDVWGWTDPQTGREYAIVGRSNGTAFVDISDPTDPVYLGSLRKTPGSLASSWRDMKVFDNHVFVVADGAGPHGMQVFDLTRLRDVAGEPAAFLPDALYQRIASVHNIAINERTGIAYALGSGSGGETCGGGLHMIDINTPTEPTFVGCFRDGTTGRAGTGYVHDAQCIHLPGSGRRLRWKGDLLRLQRDCALHRRCDRQGQSHLDLDRRLPERSLRAPGLAQRGPNDISS